MEISFVFAVLVTVVYVLINFFWWLIKTHPVNEVKPYKEQERPYVDPKVFNDVIKHQQQQRVKMYKGKL